MVENRKLWSKEWRQEAIPNKVKFKKGQKIVFINDHECSEILDGDQPPDTATHKIPKNSVAIFMGYVKLFLPYCYDFTDYETDIGWCQIELCNEQEADKQNPYICVSRTMDIMPAKEDVKITDISEYPVIDKK